MVTVMADARLNIVDGDTFYPGRAPDDRADLTGLSAPETAAVLYGPMTAEQVKRAATNPNVTATAYVNHGRWMVDCPFGCGSAQYASKDDARFLCVECLNGNTGEWVAVAWPTDTSAIEDALVVRPGRRNQNWQPPETVDDLLTENTDAGVSP